MWVSGLCWMGLGSWERGRGWLGENLELISGDNTDVHGVTPLTDGSPSLVLKERFYLVNSFPFSLLVFPGIASFISFSTQVSLLHSLSPHTCLFGNVGVIVHSLYCSLSPWHWIFGPQPR